MDRAMAGSTNSSLRKAENEQEGEPVLEKAASVLWFMESVSIDTTGVEWPFLRYPALRQMNRAI
jgi:hypothetical protein